MKTFKHHLPIIMTRLFVFLVQVLPVQLIEVFRTTTTLTVRISCAVVVWTTAPTTVGHRGSTVWRTSATKPTKQSWYRKSTTNNDYLEVGEGTNVVVGEVQTLDDRAGEFPRLIDGLSTTSGFAAALTSAGDSSGDGVSFIAGCTR